MNVKFVICNKCDGTGKLLKPKGRCNKGGRCIFTDNQGKRHKYCLWCGRDKNSKLEKLK